MLNHIWAFLVAVGVLVGVGTAIWNAQEGQKIETVVNGKKVVELKVYSTSKEKWESIRDAGNKITNAAFNSVAFTYSDENGKEHQGAVGIAIGYIGIMALWLGFMKVAEAAGLIQLLARAIAPVFRFVFPKVPPDHPAAGAMLMNIAANMLGLDNAATPLGIKAMQELQQLNGEKETASNAMCMFLALNVSSLTLIPASIIGYRVTMHSKNPTSFWVPMIIATACGKVTAITLCKIAERFSKDTPMASEVAATDIVADEEAR